MKDLIDLIGRICLASVFIFEAIDTSYYTTLTKKLMESYGFTWQMNFLYWAAIWALAIGSILVAVGYRVGLGAFLILLYWLPYTFSVYSFWMADAGHQHSEAAMFTRNIAIAGGLLLLYANGAGKYSIKRLLATTRV
jgi:putative oxidoreductase